MNESTAASSASERPSGSTDSREATRDDVAAVLTEAVLSSAASGRVILVDFDHTLLASNSTELFLSTAKPAVLASVVLAVVRGGLPWRLLGPGRHRLRDYVAVRCVTLAMPWALRVWRKKAPALFDAHLNRSVAQPLLGARIEQIVIISFGIEPILRSLLKGSMFERCRLLSTPLPCRPGLLSKGKVAQLAEASPAIDMGASVFITDSEDDRDLLDKVLVPILIPRQGHLLVAEARLYFPLRYASMAKFDERYVRDQVFGVDMVLAVMATQALWSGSALLVLATLLLHLSFQTVYEIGYFENDFLSSLTEERPTLRDTHRLFAGLAWERQAWAWACSLGALGCIALAGSARTSLGLPILLLSWGAVLGITPAGRAPPDLALSLLAGTEVFRTFGLPPWFSPGRRTAFGSSHDDVDELPHLSPGGQEVGIST